MGNGDLIRPLGCSTLSVTLGSNRYVVVFTVLSNCVADVILGWDFLSSTDAIIDCGERQLHLNTSDTDEFAGCDPVVLRTTADLCISPLTAVAVTLEPEFSFQGDYGLVEPLLTTFVQKGFPVP